VNICARK